MSKVAQATAELIFALQQEFPQARIIACDAIEGEAIHLEVRLKDHSIVGQAQDRAIELKHAVEDRYGLYALVRVLAESC
uniref:Uncharacterized protein n=2 Tax=Candidatus Bipolaricaulota TaxID=67810 RepID=H5S935_9BACT|nr:hypothetical protein HGMM_F02E06C35 [uncultured Acetothermia bacterium]BAL59274.1 hypothetical protein HGMM_OP3C429 [Candidatus Acetothermum autotrophicum]